MEQRQLRAKWLLCRTRFFWVREFIKTESATAVQREFRLRFNIQPPTRKTICRWNYQFEQIGCLCKGKSSGRQRMSPSFLITSMFLRPISNSAFAQHVLINPLNPELNPICYLLALLGAHHFIHVSRIRVKSLTLRLLMSYIYIWSTYSWCF